VGVHEHDGFFLRMGLGFAYLNSSIDVEEPVSAEGTIKGGGVGLGLMLGGTIAPGFVLGGALLGHGANEPEFEANGQKIDTKDRTLTFSVVGLFGQFYFDPTAGGYLQALIGYGQLDEDEDSSSSSSSSEERPTGAVFGIGGGYDFWVGEQWSLGPELRVLYAPLKYEETVGSTTLKANYNTTAFTLFFTATLH
jgi:hypothetical protein